MTGRCRRATVAAMMAAFFLPDAAQAMPFCRATGEVLEVLAERYGELPAGVGVTPDGALLQLLVRPDLQSWTVLLTRADGVSCVLAAGVDWQENTVLPGSDL